MNFNTVHFFFFITVVFILYSLVVTRNKLRNVVLLFASYYFYITWNWKYAFLLLIITGFNYFIGLKLETVKDVLLRRSILICGLIVNLGVLVVFKYYNFFIFNIITFFSWLGINISANYLSVILPIGISFYLFKVISYIVDLYRGKISAEKDLIKFALFVSFFPQLLAGPIQRASSFLPQLHSVSNINDKRFLNGVFLIFKGLFKKIVIADLLASLTVNAAFNNPLAFSSIDLLFALYGYAFQIYNDFSGYTDIAIGIGLLFGYDMPDNFNKPYLSLNIREFWRRWHITLSNWFRDYLYIPLGGSRRPINRVFLNLFATFLLCGLWHGAAINFIIWGAYHGLFITINHMIPVNNKKIRFPVKFTKIFISFHIITFGWLIFRVTSMQNFVEYIEGLLKLSFDFNIPVLFVFILVLSILTHLISRKHIKRIADFFTGSPLIIQATCYSILIILFCGLNLETPNFIYFQF